jgi:hypothetical protein
MMNFVLKSKALRAEISTSLNNNKCSSSLYLSDVHKSSKISHLAMFMRFYFHFALIIRFVLLLILFSDSLRKLTILYSSCLSMMYS